MDPPADPDREPMPSAICADAARTLGRRCRPTTTSWAYEMKWDGMRAIVAVEGGRLARRARRATTSTRRFPELRALGGALGARDAVLDGEIVALDEDGRPSFELLQPRMHVGVRRPRSAGSRESVPSCSCSSTCCGSTATRRWSCRTPTAGAAAREARARGARLADAADDVGDGDAMLERPRATRGSKAWSPSGSTAPTSPGSGRDAWRKVKTALSQELVVGGWLPGEGARGSSVGSLLVGYYDDGDARYAGRVGTGIDGGRARACWRRGYRARARRARSRAASRRGRIRRAGARREVGFQNWTSAGILRAPRYRGLRDDIDPESVEREP